jgi:hypothetical protein
MKANDLVTIKSEWDGDSTVFRIVEWNGDRGLISPTSWEHGSIVPTELVTLEMISLVRAG